YWMASCTPADIPTPSHLRSHAPTLPRSHAVRLSRCQALTLSGSHALRLHRFFRFTRLHTVSQALRAKTVREGGLRSIRNVPFYAMPIVLVVANAFAINTNRQQPLQLLHLSQSLLQ